METETSDIISPEKIIAMELEARRVIDNAPINPSEAELTTIARATQFLDTLAAQRSRGSGDQ